MKALQRYKWHIVSAAGATLLMFSPAAFAYAATLSLSSASANVVAGNIVTVTIAVNSSDQAINTAEGTLQFPSDVLQVLSLDKSSSVFSIWIEDPSFSNTTGEVTFSGGLPTPGYQGVNGTVLKVSFLAKRAGSATLSLADADVRANDGLGTDVLQSTGTLQLTVVNAPVVQPTPAPAPARSPVPVTPVKSTASTTAATSSIAIMLLQAPLIIAATPDVPVGGVAEITGTSLYPGATAELSLQESDGQSLSSETTVAQNGSFTLTNAHPPSPGLYIGSVTVQVGNQQSPPSAPFTVNFEGISLSDRVIGFLSETASLVALGMIFAFILGSMFGYYFFKVRNGAPMRETLRDIDVEVHKAFLTLRSRINDSLDELEKGSKTHQFTAAEKHFVSEVTDTIKGAEKEIEKDVRHPDA